MKRTIEMYEDIIDMPRPKSKNKKPMSLTERAAQFSPFAALSGHNEELRETARLSSDKIELDEMEKELLSVKLKTLESRLHEQINISICYFIKDPKKEGGKYITIDGTIKQIDMINQLIILTDKTKIPMDNVIEINSSIFDMFESL